MSFDTRAMAQILGEMMRAGDVQSLRHDVVRGLALLGISRGYFIAPLSRDHRVGRSLTNIGLPAEWELQYRTRLYRSDPLPTLSLDFSNAFFWPDEVPFEKMTNEQQAYMQIASEFGLGRGIGTACYGPHGRAGFLGAACDSNVPEDDVTKLAVHQIGQVSFQRYCQLNLEEIEIPTLSNREQSVLNLMCRGRTNPEMADMIGVSRSSIDSYIRRIFAKLQVSDRTAACVRAQSLGLVVTEEVERLVREARKRDEEM